MDDQPVVHVAKLHWIIFLWPTILSIIAFLVVYLLSIPQYQLQMFQLPTLIVGGVGVLWWGLIWFTYRFSSLTIKPKQVILRTGFLVRQTIDIPLDKIASIDITQSIVGSILNYGMFVITGTGGTQQQINFLTGPLTCRRYIEQLLNASHTSDLNE